MYNAELKTRFIREYTQNLHTAKIAERVFESMSKYEEEWGADLCTKDENALSSPVGEIIALRSKSQWSAMSILQDYVKWCIAMRVPGACDGMLHVEAVGLSKVRRQMVSSPLQLQQYMDEVFDSVEEENMDIVYRCYYWLGYFGIKEEDTLLIKADDVDFINMEIPYKHTHVQIYREAIPVLRKAIELDSFVNRHPHYGKSVRLPRIPGDTLLRGIRSSTKIVTIRSTLSKVSAKALEEGKTNKQLSFSRIRNSGLFYRMYEIERAGGVVDFSEAALDFMDGKTYTFNENLTEKQKKNRVEREYMEDYQRWKLAFSV